MKRFAVALGFVVALAACDTASEAVDESSRTTAKAAVDEVLVRKFPQVPREQVTPYSDCIIDAANSRELLALSKAAVVGVDDGTISLVGDLLARPETLECLAKVQLAGLSG